jgi:tetratricopeptide (TPR) repeat protein
MIKYILSLAVLFQLSCFAFSSYAGDSSVVIKEAQSLFRQADEAMLRDAAEAEKLYLKAALRFESLTTEENSINNSKLYYNMANAYYRSGRIGKAILYYRKAEVYDPTDSKVHDNLAFVRSKCIDSTQDSLKREWTKMLLPWHYMDRSGKIMLFVIAYLLFWTLIAYKTIARAKTLRLTVGLSVIALLLFGGSIFCDIYRNMNIKNGVVVSREVVARKGGAYIYQPMYTTPLHEGTEFVFKEKRGGWYRIKLGDDEECWVPENSIELVN